jgi:hypothetical protein
MAKAEKTENTTNTTHKPISVIDCKNYVELKEPKTPGFGNKSKSINDIDDSYSHDVVDYYGP